MEYFSFTDLNIIPKISKCDTALSHTESEEIRKKSIFPLLLIGACSSRGMLREINLILQCDKFNVAPSAGKPGTGHATPRKITLSGGTNRVF